MSAGCASLRRSRNGRNGKNFLSGNSLRLAGRVRARIDYVGFGGVGCGPADRPFPCAFGQEDDRGGVLENEPLQPELDPQGGFAPGPVLEHDRVLKFRDPGYLYAAGERPAAKWALAGPPVE